MKINEKSWMSKSNDKAKRTRLRSRKLQPKPVPDITSVGLSEDAKKDRCIMLSKSDEMIKHDPGISQMGPCPYYGSKVTHFFTQYTKWKGGSVLLGCFWCCH